MYGHYYPEVVRFDATWKCNLNCKHCQTSMFRGPSHPEDLSDAEVMKLFSELATMGTRQVNFLGGEPLLRNNLLDQIRYLQSRGIHSDITTNGLLITQDMANELFDNRVIVAVSLDGANAEQHDFIRGRNTFNRTLDAIRLLVEQKRQRRRGFVGISTVLNRRNMHQAELLLISLVIYRLIISLCQQYKELATPLHFGMTFQLMVLRSIT
jgi:MoaA/NifB/PqqE/SkfB family radical SAM enzyme